mmetsp:Transcript_10495/g.15777  ORF Transcript_10495/g.15777 Transcript_10495/m.15777 type:complete len:110 (+) Transcript_10495:232-561(+)
MKKLFQVELATFSAKHTRADAFDLGFLKRNGYPSKIFIDGIDLTIIVEIFMATPSSITTFRHGINSSCSQYPRCKMAEIAKKNEVCLIICREAGQQQLLNMIVKLIFYE